MKQVILSVAAIAFMLSTVQCSAAEPSCSYSLDPATTQVGWTAFKTTAKVGVKGQFTRFTVDVPEKADSVAALLKGLEFSIDSTSVSTGDVARDGVISAFFFQQMVGKPEIKGGVEKVDGTDSGTIQVRVFMNSESNLIPMSFKLNKDNQIVATGQLNILDFGAGQPMAALNQACHEQHKGEDGVSKTWSEVELKLSSTLKKECS